MFSSEAVRSEELGTAFGVDRSQAGHGVEAQTS